MTVAKGMKVNLVRVGEGVSRSWAKPVQMSFDAKGRLLGRRLARPTPTGSPRRSMDDKAPESSRNTNGDGKADTVKVFA